MIGVFACTLKLSAGMVVLFCLYPLISLIKSHHWKSIGIYILSSIVIVLPFLVRNVIISGYLLYPVLSIDLFNVPWKMPASLVKYDVDGMIIWARTLNLQYSSGALTWEEALNYPITGWLPQWFSTLSLTNKILFVSCLLGSALYIIKVIIQLIKYRKISLSDFAVGVALISFLFWLYEAPLIRYGDLYLWLLFSLFIAVYCKQKGCFCLSVIMLALSINACIPLAGSILPLLANCARQTIPTMTLLHIL